MASRRCGRAARTSGAGWSRGMIAGGGTSASAGQTARHVPVLLAEAMQMLAPRSRRRLCRRDVRRRRLQPRHSRRRRYAGDRHRPRPHGDRRGLRPGRSLGWTARAGRGPVLRISPTSAARRDTTRSTASSWTSASRRCSSTRPRAASRSASTARSTCAWGATGRAQPT